jgi:hypothetical protein
MRTFMIFIAALWFGGGAALMFLAAPAAFAAAADRTSAANVVGAILARWHYLALVAPVIVLAVDFRRGLPSTLRVILLAAAIFLAVGQVAADAKIRSIRSSAPVPISELAKDDPARRTFGLLHGISTVLMLLQVVAAGGVLVTLERRPL